MNPTPARAAAEKEALRRSFPAADRVFFASMRIEDVALGVVGKAKAFSWGFSMKKRNHFFVKTKAAAQLGLKEDPSEPELGRMASEPERSQDGVGFCFWLLEVKDPLVFEVFLALAPSYEAFKKSRKRRGPSAHGFCPSWSFSDK